MQVMKITFPAEAPLSAACLLRDKRFYDGNNCHRAEKLTKKMPCPLKRPGLFVHPAQGPEMLTPDFEIAFLLKHVYHKQCIVSRREAFY
jgi:hypothetical protein